VFEFGEEQITLSGGSQQRLALIATAGDEVEVPRAVIAMQASGHGVKIRQELQKQM
jgi:hypothetical protein